ncbi:hypothetical protein B7486_73570, partial [cyanobacterium TDX16]
HPLNHHEPQPEAASVTPAHAGAPTRPSSEAATRRVGEPLRRQGIEARSSRHPELQDADDWAVGVQQRHLRRVEAALAAEQGSASQA